MSHAVLEMRLIIKQNDAIWKAKSAKRFCNAPQKSIWGERHESANIRTLQPSVPSTSIEIHTSDEHSLSDEPEDANAKDTDNHSSPEDNLMAVEDNL